MPTTIHFTSGEKVQVSTEPKEVRRLLGEDRQRGEPFCAFKTTRSDRAVYVAPTAVAYLEETRERTGTAQFH